MYCAAAQLSNIAHSEMVWIFDRALELIGIFCLHQPGSDNTK